MKIGIVGHEAKKFTETTEAAARAVIRSLLAVLVPGPDSLDRVISGRSPLGGIDVWAIEEATAAGIPVHEFPPATNRWEDGFKPRNLQIAAASDVVHVIVVETLPPTFQGRRWGFCYHDGRRDHVKSGGCWTALRCARRRWHIIAPDGAVREVA